MRICNLNMRIERLDAVVCIYSDKMLIVDWLVMNGILAVIDYRLID